MNIRSCFVIMAQLIVGVWAPCVAARDFGASFPSPLGVREGDRIALYLNLSDMQLRSVEDLLVAHREKWGTLLSGPMQDFETRYWPLNAIRFGQLELERERAVVVHSILTKIESLDRGFLEDLTEILAPIQVEMLEQVRLYLERRRYLNYRTKDLLKGLLVDFESIPRAHEGSEFQKSNFDQVLLTHERRLNDLLRRLHELSLFADVDSDRLLEIRRGLHRLNEATVQRLLEMNAADQRTAILDFYYRRAYAEVHPDDQALFRAFALALEAEDLSDETRASIQKLHTQYIADHERTSGHLLSEIDRYRLSVTMQQPDIVDEYSGHIREMRRLREERRAINEAALASLRPELPASGLASLPGLDAVASAPSPAFAGNETVAINCMKDGRRATRMVNSSDRFLLDGAFHLELPEPSEETEFHRYVRWFDLDDDQQVIARSIYDDYLESYQPQRGAWERQLGSARLSLRKDGVSDPRQRSRLWAIWGEATEALRAIDDDMVIKLDLLFGDPPNESPMERIRLARRRARARRIGTAGILFMLLRSESDRRDVEVDLSVLVSQLNAEARDAEEILAIVLEYEEVVTPQFEARRSVQLAAQRLDDELFAGERYDQLAGRDLFEIEYDYDEAARRVYKPFQRSSEAIAETNRVFLDRLMAVLPESEAGQLADDFLRIAFWRTFVRLPSLHDSFDKALASIELTDDQRVSIIELRQRYRPAYDLIIDQIIADEQKNERYGELTGSPGGERLRHIEAGMASDKRKRRFVADGVDLNARTLRELTRIVGKAAARQLDIEGKE